LKIKSIGQIDRYAPRVYTENRGNQDMKKLVFIIGVFVLGLILLAQELQHETGVINIEVPVRVFTKGKFVEELALKDFELYEEGVLQKIEALYLIKKTVIEKEETELDTKQAGKIFMPETSRTFILMFEMMDYFPEIRETLDYFFENVISPGDSLFVITPLKTYTYEKEFLDETPSEEIADQTNKKLRKDIKSVAMEYKSMINDLQWLAKTDNPLKAEAADKIFEKIIDYRHFDDKKLMKFKDQLKEIEGQKYVFLFYQKQIIPLPPEFAVDREKRIFFNSKKIKQSYADSSININFIFLTKTKQSGITRTSSTKMVMDDLSAKMYGALREVAEATGGITDSSANIAASFQQAAVSSENYYLLYYTPKDYKADGEFKNIAVKIKGKNYKITHRAGYIAN
jgi:VWFA-related protein